MPKVLHINLKESQRAELERVVFEGSKPYLRERAAAILKIASGVSGRQVARYGLLRKRRKDTVYEWVHRYKAEGIKGLQIRSGRGRKPSFSP